jgi:hypothetical protein
VASDCVISDEFRDEIYSFLNSEITIVEFEQWVYANANTLENELDETTFFELISFSYQLSGARYDLIKLLKPLINEADFEKYRILKLLNDTLVYSPNSQQNIAQFYDLYCGGYYFFQDLAFPYGLDTDNNLAEEIIQSYYPEIIVEIEKVIHWIENKEIILNSLNKEEFPKYDFEDNRQLDIPKKQNYQHLPKKMRPQQKKWWQFWK